MSYIIIDKGGNEYPLNESQCLCFHYIYDFFLHNQLKTLSSTQFRKEHPKVMPSDIKFIFSVLTTLKVVKQKVKQFNRGAECRLWLRNKYFERFTDEYNKYIKWVNHNHYWFYYKENKLIIKHKKYYIEGKVYDLDRWFIEIYVMFNKRMLWDKFINRSSIYVRCKYMGTKKIDEILQFYEDKNIIGTLLKNSNQN